MQECRESKDWPVYISSNTFALHYYRQRISEVAKPNIKRLEDFARKSKMRIVYTLFSLHIKDGIDSNRQVQEIEGLPRETTGGSSIPREINPDSITIESKKPKDGDIVIVETSSSAFTDTGLEYFLRNIGIEQLLVVGDVTNICVEDVVSACVEFGFEVIIIKGACADRSPQIHKTSLDTFELLFWQCDVHRPSNQNDRG